MVAVNAQTKEQQIENDQLLAKSLEMELTREARAVRKSAARDFVGTVSPPPSPRMDPTRRVFYTAAQEAAARPRHLAEQRIHESAERHAARRERALERRLRRDSLDEEMAARLQVEWSQEAFERWARAADAGETDAAMASRLQNEWDSQHETDAEMARRLEAEWNMDVDVEPLATPTTARQAANAGEPMAVDLEASAAPDSSGTGLSVEELTMLEEEYGPDVWKPGFLKDLLGSLPDGGE